MATTGDAGGAPRLYHERQESGFCGAHALNCLLQAPLLDEVALAQVAAELDAREAKLREGPALPAGGGGPPPRASRSTDSWMVRKLEGADGTANVDAAGNFSVSVLAQALSAFGAELLTPTQADAQTRRAGGAAQSGVLSAPHLERGFLLNRASHWYALRRVRGAWYDFNSLLAAPQHLSDFHLGAMLAELADSGGNVFVVRGALPDREPQPDDACERGRYWSPEEAAAALAEAVRAASEGDALAAALAASVHESQRVLERTESEDADLACAIAASLAD